MGGRKPRELDLVQKYKHLEYASGGISLLAAWLIADKIYLQGFILHMLGDALWIWWGHRTGAYGLAFTQIVFFIISAYGLYNL